MPQRPGAVCPVPSEQQPIEEYAALKESCGFGVCVRGGGPYWQRMAWVWGLAWPIAGPVAAASFVPTEEPLRFFLSGSAGASLVLGLELLRLYSGWRYVCHRLHASEIAYEESGWYDGCTWTKPPQMRDRDRLIATYEIPPILDRLHRTFAILAGLCTLGAICWGLL